MLSRHARQIASRRALSTSLVRRSVHSWKKSPSALCSLASLAPPHNFDTIGEGRRLFSSQPPPGGGMPPWINPQAAKPGHHLEQYTTDLTQMAHDGKLDPVIGRHEEIRRCLQILARRTKNNPVLIGEAGVGKTAIAEGLAQRIDSGEVPESMKGKKSVEFGFGRSHGRCHDAGSI